jgi:hypothetical protein
LEVVRPLDELKAAQTFREIIITGRLKAMGLSTYLGTLRLSKGKRKGAFITSVTPLKAARPPGTPGSPNAGQRVSDPVSRGVMLEEIAAGNPHPEVCGGDAG